jgi:glutamine cyclotransferase
MHSVRVIAILLFALYVGGCNPDKKNRKPGKKAITAVNYASITTPSLYGKYPCGQEIQVFYSVSEDAPGVDSLVFQVNGQFVSKAGFTDAKVFIKTEGFQTGTQQLTMVTYYNDQTKETDRSYFVLLPDIIPEKINYTVVNTWPHDKQAYTQGLFYHEGWLYESTGQWGQSSLRKVNISNGEVQLTMPVDNKLFAEGIALLDNKIYQLTYKSQTGFVYTIQDFSLVKQFTYPNAEGWGLTSDSSVLIMSDGTHKLYFIDPHSFKTFKELEVYNQNGQVTRLNELEYVKGKIYANVYGEQYIVRINPETGTVEAILDLNGILDARYHHPELDVLNGIAYNDHTGHFYVTGKNWPLLFEIQILN